MQIPVSDVAQLVAALRQAIEVIGPEEDDEAGALNSTIAHLRTVADRFEPLAAPPANSGNVPRGTDRFAKVGGDIECARLALLAALSAANDPLAWMVGTPLLGQLATVANQVAQISAALAERTVANHP